MLWVSKLRIPATKPGQLWGSAMAQVIRQPGSPNPTSPLTNPDPLPRCGETEHRFTGTCSRARSSPKQPPAPEVPSVGRGLSGHQVMDVQRTPEVDRTQIIIKVGKAGQVWAIGAAKHEQAWFVICIFQTGRIGGCSCLLRGRRYE